MKIILKGGTVLEFSLKNYLFVFNKDTLTVSKTDKFRPDASFDEFVIPTSYMEGIEL